MTILTGHPKIFNASKCLEVDGSTIVASTGDASSSYSIDRNQDTFWTSVASDDSTTETLTVTFAEDIAIDTLLFLDINWKGFVVKYDVAGTWTHFAAVFGLDGSKSNITETAFSDNTAYYNFTEVTTGSIQITITTTQTVNAEKYISQIIATTEVGTFLGWPLVENMTFDRNSRVKTTLSGKVSVQKSLESFSTDLKFKNYPSTSTYNADIDLIMTLQDIEDPFILWLCGGRRGTYFNYIIRGYRLKDAITVQITSALGLSYTDNVLKNPVNAGVSLAEHI